MFISALQLSALGFFSIHDLRLTIHGLSTPQLFAIKLTLHGLCNASRSLTVYALHFTPHGLCNASRSLTVYASRFTLHALRPYYA